MLTYIAAQFFAHLRSGNPAAIIDVMSKLKPKAKRDAHADNKFSNELITILLLSAAQRGRDRFSIYVHFQYLRWA